MTMKTSSTHALWLLLGLVVACGGGEDPPPDEGQDDRHIAFRRARIAVPDTADGQVTVIDAEFSEVRAVLDLPNPAMLFVSGTGSVAAAVDATDGTVRFFSSGVSIIDHTGEGWEGKEHIHVYKFAPAVLDATLTGANPGPLKAYGTAWAAYFAGDDAEPANATLFDEAPLIQNDVLTPVVAEDAQPARRGRAPPRRRAGAHGHRPSRRGGVVRSHGYADCHPNGLRGPRRRAARGRARDGEL